MKKNKAILVVLATLFLSVSNSVEKFPVKSVE
jgi:hypothetical protein